MIKYFAAYTVSILHCIIYLILCSESLHNLIGPTDQRILEAFTGRAHTQTHTHRLLSTEI